MVGYALTSSCRSAAPDYGVDAYNGLEQQIEQFSTLPGPAVVVFQDLDDPPAAATFGDLMCSMYRNFGAVGLVSTGAGRDLASIRSMRFPVFAPGTICAHGFCHTLSVGSPVRIGGLVVRHGDLLHGDCNGVTTIPSEIVTELPEIAAQFATAEQRFIHFLQSSVKKTLAMCQQRRAEFQSELMKIKASIRAGTSH